MTIREAGPDDVAALAALSGELGYSSTPGEISDRLAMLRQRSADAVFVAEVDGAVVAWLHVAGMLFLESPPFAEVAGLVVAETQRGKGTGKRLLAAAAQWAAARGYRKLRVRSNVIRQDAHRFYEREGYRRIKEQVVLDLELSPG